MQNGDPSGDKGNRPTRLQLNQDLNPVDSPRSDQAQPDENTYPDNFNSDDHNDFQEEGFNLNDIDLQEQMQILEQLQNSARPQETQGHSGGTGELHNSNPASQQFGPNDDGRYAAKDFDDNDVDMDANQYERDAALDNNMQGQWDEQAHDDQPEDEMLVNEEIEELQDDLQQQEVETYFFNDKPQETHAASQVVTYVSGFSSGTAKNLPNISGEQAWNQLQELGNIIAKAIEKKTEPIKEFDELNTLIEQHYGFICIRLRELGAKKEVMQNADPDFELSAEQIEEQKALNEAALKEQAANCAKRDAWLKAAFEDPAFWVLEEKILMKYEYLLEISRFFRCLVVFIFPRMVEVASFAKIIDDILNINASLYGAINYKKGIRQGLQSQLSESDIKKKEMIQKMNTHTELYEKWRVVREESWRASLKPDDYIDALNTFATPCNTNDIHNIRGWCPAKVTKVTDERVTVAYLGMPKHQQVQFRKDSVYIAPPKTFTDNFDVRYELKPGDEFDCCDDYGIWYKSTVKQVFHENEQDIEGQPVKKVHVAFRFKDPDGQKVDHEGNRVTGFLLDKFDMVHYLASPSIKPFQSMSYFYNDIKAQSMKCELDISIDIQDVIYTTKNIVEFAVPRENQFSGLKHIATIVNEFGQSQGFEQIISFFQKVQSGELETDYVHFLYMHNFLIRTLPLWSREFVCNYTPRVSQAYIAAIVSHGPDSLSKKQFQKEHFGALVNNLSGLLRRYYVPAKYQSMVNYLNTAIGSNLLASKNLEKRIQGIKMISDQIKEARQSSYVSRQNQEASAPDNNTAKLVKDLNSLKLFENVFAPGKFHLQICQRAGELFKIYAMESKLTDDQMEMLYDAASKDEASKIEVYKMFSDCSNYLEDALVQKFVKRLDSLDSSLYQARDIELVFNLARTSYKGTEAKESAIQFLYQIATNLKPGVSMSLLKPARKHFQDLLKNQSQELKEGYICKCIDRISDEQNLSVQSIKILVNMVKSMPKYNYSKNDRAVSQKEFVRDLVKHQELIQIFINDLAAYKRRIIAHLVDIASQKKLQQTVKKSSETNQNLQNSDEQLLQDAELFEEGLTHAQNIEARLKAILFTLETCEGSEQLQRSQLHSLWDILTQDQVLESDRELFFKFFKIVLNEKNWIDTSVVCELFEKKIQGNIALLANVQLESFNCIQAMFLIINENQNGLNIISQPKDESRLSFKPASKASSEDKTKVKLEIRVHLPPQQLTGIEVIWEMFRHTNRNKDLDLQANIIFFLALVHQSLSRLLWPRKKEIYHQFTTECFQNISNIVADPNQHSSVKEELVKNTMYMLKEFFQASEKRGTACIRPHASLELPNRVFNNILIINLIATTQTPKHIVMSVNCQTTIWELLDTLAKKVNRSPLKIKLQRDAKKPEINVHHFCKSLLDLKFEDSEEIIIVKQPEASGKVPLINPQTSQLVREVEDIFGQWFDRFSLPAESFSDGDYENNQEPRYMTKQTCVEFLTHTVAELNNFQGMKQMPNFEENKSINELFSTYDSDQDGRLNKADFLKFYTDKSNSAPDKVWQNLIQHEIGKDLLACPKREPTYENDVNVVRDQTELPRYLISSQAQNLDFLFNLGQQINSDTNQAQKAKDAIWRLITSTKTNVHMYLGLLRNENIEQLTDKSQPIHKQLYLLQILQSFVNAYSKFGEDSPNQIKFKCYYDAKKTANKNKTGWNQEENFPTIQEPEKGKKFGNLQMQPQGTTKCDNHPPSLESIEEAREPDYRQPEPKQRNLEGSHWQGVNVLPDGNVPIALPATEPQESGDMKVTNTQGDQFKYESNTKDSYYRQVVNQWKGETQDECFESENFTAQELINLMLADQRNQKNQIVDESEEAGKEYIEAMLELEEMRRNWLLNFIKKGGFQVLLNIMTSIVTKYANKEAKDTLNMAAEVEVLQIVTYMIRVILISCFCSQTQDQNLSNNLQRKLSSVNDEEMLEKPSSKENQHLTKQTVITQQFKDLIGLLSDDKTTSRHLLESVEFNEVHRLIDLTIETILKKQYQATNPEKAIVAECLNIFISCVSFNGELLNQVFKGAKNDSRFYRTFIIQGLLGDSIILRAQFKDALLFIAENVKHVQLDQVPLVFFLQNLVMALEEISLAKARNTSQFFQLLSKLIGSYLKNANLIPVPDSFQKIIDPAYFTKRVLQLLFNYESCETQNSVVTDFTLLGLLKLSRNLLLLRPGILSAEECGQTLNILVTTFLFNQNQEVIKGHIRKNTNVQTLKQSQSNRCHTIKSREAAYSLMDAIISTNNDPEIINNLFETFWAPYIMQLSMQKDNNNYNPEENNRASCGFVGLKNLANICYMNSVIQQMFNVPAFRYSLMAADQRGDKDLVDHEGRQIVDNYLYQWMRMFAFLSMSDRKEYNPRDFCFSHKQPGGAPTNVRVQMDAQEFINMAFDKLENSLKNTPQKYLVQNIFQGQTASLIICRSCGNINQNEEDFYCLTLNVRGKKTLQHSLESMVQGEIIEGYQCNACNQKTEIEKKLAIQNLPNTLIVHLNRITFDLEQLRNIKINDKLEFPNTLNVKKYMVEEVHREQRRKLRQKMVEQRRKNLQQPEDSDQPKLQREDSKQQEEEQIDTKVQDQDMRDENADRLDEDEEDLVGDRKLSNEDCDFKLVGVVIHMGVAEAGHYLSYINIERESDQSDYKEWLQTNKQNWMIFNDSTVSTFEFSRIPDQCFGEESSVYKDSSQKSHNAYMLIYEKAIKQPLKIVCDDEVIRKIQDLPEQVLSRLDCQSNSLACDSTAISRGNASDSIVNDVTQLKLSSNASLDQMVEANLEWIPHSYLIYPEILKHIHSGEGIQMDEKTKEKFLLVPFNQVERFVPQDFYAQIHQDNQLFLAEKQVMCNAFFKTTAFLLQQVVKQTDSCEDFDARKQKLSKVFNIIDKIIFEMIANGSEQKHLKEIQDLLFMVLDRSESSLIFLIEERILVGTKKTEDQKNPDKPFFDMLVFNKQQEVRELAEQILSKATHYLYERLEDPNTYESEDSIKAVRGPLDTIIDAIISMMPLECMKAWHKLGAYFGYLLSLVKDGNAKAISDLNQRKTVSKLIGLVTKFKEQQAYETSVPPFDKLVLTISYIVRSQPLVIYLNGISENHQPVYEDTIKAVEQLGAHSPYYKPFKPEVVASEHIFLKGDDLRAVMMVDKKPKEFYTLALKYTQEADEVSHLMGHICFNNYYLSKNIGKILLKGLNHTTEIELAPFLNPMGVYLSIDDQYQAQRIEWLMGLPDIKMERPQDPHLINDPRFTIQTIGLQRVKDIEQIIFDYKSLLFREFSAYKESILTILYNYRKEKFPRAMLLITDALFKAMVSLDKRHMILKYLLACEPPSYAYRRYFDWFEPHFVAQIQKCSENLSSPQLQEEFEMSLRVHSNIEKLKAEQSHLFKIDLEDVPDLGAWKYADPYLVWNIASEKVMVKITNADSTVHGVLHELSVNVTKSRPTGTFNDSLTRVIRGHSIQFKQRQVTQEDRQKWGDRIRKAKGGKHEKEQMRAKRAQARQNRKKREEEDGSDGDAEAVEEINTFVDENGETRYYKKVQEPAEETEKNDQPNNDQKDANEEICNWQTNLNQMDEGIEFDRENYSNPEHLDFGNKVAIASDPPTNIPWPSQVSQGGQVEQNNQDATGVPGNLDSDECFKADYDDDEDMPEDQTKQMITNDPKSEHDIDEQQVHGCVMVLVIRNFNKYQAKNVRIEFPAELKDQMNWQMPSTEMSYFVSKTTDKTTMAFVKKRLYEDWGPIGEFRLFVEDQAFDGTTCHIYDRDYPELRAAKKLVQDDQFQQAAQHAAELAQTTTLPAETEPAANFGVSLSSNEKECPVCTYINYKNARTCEMCENSF